MDAKYYLFVYFDNAVDADEELVNVIVAIIVDKIKFVG